MRYQFWLLLVINLCVVHSTHAAHVEDPKQLLDGMFHASHRIHYDGIFIYQYQDSDTQDVMRIIHKFTEDGGRERLIKLSGEPKEIICDRGEVRYYLPKQQLVIVDKIRDKTNNGLLTKYFPNVSAMISDMYTLELVGEDRVAGYDAWILNIKSNDEFRYSYQLWIEKDAKFLLRSKVMYKDVVLEHVMFTMFNILTDIDDKDIQSSLSANHYVWTDISGTKDVVIKPNKIIWQSAWFPDGFHLIEHSNQVMLSNGLMVERMIVSDGLGMVSVFAESLSKASPVDGTTMQSGGVHTYVKYLNGHQITVVGDVPIITIEKIVNSITLDIQ